MKFNTRLLHGHAVQKYASGSTLPQIAQANAFRYDSAEEISKVFHHKAPGFSYTRLANPTVSAFEQRISEMESGHAAIACSSGMAAISLSLLNVLCSGDELIASAGLYSGSIDLFESLERFGITARFVSHMTPENIDPLINDKTRLIFAEVLSNPGLEIIDVKALSEFSHSHSLPLIVDATTITPFLCRPLELGADIVIHSTTKYINGSGDAVGGVIIDGAKFSWDFERYRALREYKGFGRSAYTVRLRMETLENFGSCMAPMTGFLNVIGLETLGLRMERICGNAHRLAKALNELPGISVNYPLLDDNPNRDLAIRQLNGYGGGILTFRAGSQQRAYDIINGLKYAVKATSIGDTRTLVIHPASTLYICNTQEQREAAGVHDDTVRVSTGIEDAEDLVEDFTKAITQN